MRSLVIGGAVGALALSSGSVRAEDEKPHSGALVVERDSQESAADAALRAKLAGPAAQDVGRSATLSALAAAYGKSLGVNVTVTDAARDTAGDRAVPLPTAAALTVAQHIDFALWQLGAQVAVKDGGLVIGATNEVVGTVDRRVYDLGAVRKALAAGDDERAAPEVVDEYVVAILQGSVRSYAAWGGKGVSISTVEGGLAVTQTAEVHAEVEAFLRHLAQIRTPSEEPASAASAANERLAAGLATSVSIRADEMPLRDVAAELEQTIGVPVMADVDCADAPITLDLVDLPAQQAATWCARRARVYLSTHDGVLLFSDSPPTETRVYALGAVTRPPSGRVMLDHVVELATSLEPRTWEEIGSAEALMPDLLIVKNTPAVHAQFENLIDALGRLGDSGSATSAVPVIVETPGSAADAAVRSRLGAAATWTAPGVPVSELPAAIRLAYGVNVVFGSADVVGDDVNVTARAEDGLTAGQQLSAALRPEGLDFGVRDGVLVIDRVHSIVGSAERRFYDLRPIAESFAARAASESHAEGEPGSRHASMGAEDIVGLVHNCVGEQDLWTYAGVSLACGRDWIVAVHTHDVHERMHHMLERLLDYEGHTEGVVADPLGDVRFYDIGETLGTARGSHSAADLMAGVMAIAPHSWEDVAWAEVVTPDLLVVKNDEAVHAQIAKLLERLSEK